jgi:hypothetical protein
MINLVGQKVGILRVILEKEKTTQTILYSHIVKECEKLGMKPLTKSQISHFCFGDKPDSKISTYLKLLIGINAIKRRPEPYTLEEIIEKDEIIKSANRS